ncbi:MAG: hypothetical protein K0R54_634 [Clostridiaceae bacterium]|jgi:hypothetical protein|nr:hypothetical protein [Clostridiaceae bacterium]
MKIKDIKKDCCGECELIDFCGEPFSEVHLCTDSRIENMEVEVYIKTANSLPYENIKEKANKLGWVIDSDVEMTDEEQEEFDIDHDCLDNYKKAVLEYLVDKFKNGEMETPKLKMVSNFQDLNKESPNYWNEILYPFYQDATEIIYTNVQKYSDLFLILSLFKETVETGTIFLCEDEIKYMYSENELSIQVNSNL